MKNEIQTKNEAQTLLAKLTGKLKDKAVVDVAGTEFTFYRDDAAYDVFVNEIAVDNKLTPIKNYLLAIITREQKDELLTVINVPGLAQDIAAVVNKEFVPQIEVTLKN